MSCVKFLGELYNYRMVESSVIFKTLYSFITFGVILDGRWRYVMRDAMSCVTSCHA